MIWSDWSPQVALDYDLEFIDSADCLNDPAFNLAVVAWASKFAVAALWLFAAAAHAETGFTKQFCPGLIPPQWRQLLVFDRLMKGGLLETSLFHIVIFTPKELFERIVHRPPSFADCRRPVQE